MPHGRALYEALATLGWVEGSWERCGRLWSGGLDAAPGCLLQRTLQLHRHHPWLSESGLIGLSELTQAGWCLRNSWRHPGNSTLPRWLGHRFYLGSVAALISPRPCHAVVSSRLGRHFRQLPHWPLLLDQALSAGARQQAQLLLVAGTTLCEAAAEFARAADMPTLEIVLPRQAEGSATAASWLASTLDRLSSPAQHSASEPVVLLSPELDSSQASADLAQYPLQDRVMIGLADQLRVLSVRKRGTIANLLQQRLSDRHFPLATVYLAMPPARSDWPAHGLDHVQQWLDRGAVGWTVRVTPANQLGSLNHCRQVRWRGPAVCQLAAPAERFGLGDVDSSPYLVHCTRALESRWPGESTAAYLRRVWQAGSDRPAHPLLTLARSLGQGVLRATYRWTRGSRPAVSLSAVPLLQLLGRRQFRPHLGRWDWEPYGLLLRREHLVAVRPVIYGTEADYRQLAAADRDYFQPLGGKLDWSQEREWRHLGDLDLRRLPPAAVVAFVRSRGEAAQFGSVFTVSDRVDRAWLERGLRPARGLWPPPPVVVAVYLSVPEEPCIAGRPSAGSRVRLAIDLLARTGQSVGR